MEDRPVPTEAEKFEMKRKRSIEATQPVEEEECPCFDETGYYCDECIAVLQAEEKAQKRAGKGPAYRQVEAEEEDDAEGEGPPEPEDESDLPDLHQYFDRFEIPDEKVISMCRAYASYLSSLRPKKITSAFASPRRKAATKDPEPPSQKKHYWDAKRRRK